VVLLHDAPWDATYSALSIFDKMAVTDVVALCSQYSA
jgi:hypothetical protein